MTKHKDDDEPTTPTPAHAAHGTAPAAKPKADRKRVASDVPFEYETPFADEAVVDHAEGADEKAVGKDAPGPVEVWLYDVNRTNPTRAKVRLIDPNTAVIGGTVYRRFAVHPSGVGCFGLAAF